MKLTDFPILKTAKAYAWVIVLALTVAAFTSVAISAYRMGRTAGKNAVTVILEKERQATARAALNASQDALKRSEQAAQAAREQQAKDLQAALKASEERQAARVLAAIRQGSLEKSTRAPGSAYTDPKCVLDADTMNKLQEAMK